MESRTERVGTTALIVSLSLIVSMAAHAATSTSSCPSEALPKYRPFIAPPPLEVGAPPTMKNFGRRVRNPALKWSRLTKTCRTYRKTAARSIGEVVYDENLRPYARLDEELRERGGMLLKGRSIPWDKNGVPVGSITRGPNGEHFLHIWSGQGVRSRSSLNDYWALQPNGRLFHPNIRVANKAQKKTTNVCGYGHDPGGGGVKPQRTWLTYVVEVPRGTTLADIVEQDVTVRTRARLTVAPSWRYPPRP